MNFGLSAFALARMQFAFTVSFHIIFPATSIGLACFLAVLEWKWLRSRNPLYQDLFKYWLKIWWCFQKYAERKTGKNLIL